MNRRADVAYTLYDNAVPDAVIYGYLVAGVVPMSTNNDATAHRRKDLYHKTPCPNVQFDLMVEALNTFGNIPHKG